LDLTGGKWWEAGEDYIMSFIKCHYDDKIKENEVDRTCSTHGRNEEFIESFSRKT